jgi:type VI secretion system protein ImpK
MREDIANLVHPVLSYGLRLKERVARGEAGDMDTEQATLKGLLLGEMEARRVADYGGERGSVDQSTIGGRGMGMDAGRRGDAFLGIRYALVCWLDEIFIIDSPWSQEWNEHKLESMLYGSNDRAWAFWEQARKAESRPGGDAMEVFFLCVMLGFRGEYRDQPDRLQAWHVATQARLAKSQGQEMQLPPELDPPVFVPPRYWRDRMQRMVVVAAVVALCLIPVVAFVLVNQFASP